MKISFHICLYVILLASFSYSQKSRRDTAEHVYLYDHLLNLQSKFEEFDMYRKLYYMRMDLQENNDPNTIWMWTTLSINNSGIIDFHPGQSPGSMIEPLHQQYIENAKLNPVRYVLGIAQTAAVGYLAYQHIKKYGLLK